MDVAGRRVREALAALVDSALENKLGESPGLLKDLAVGVGSKITLDVQLVSQGTQG